MANRLNQSFWDLVRNTYLKDVIVNLIHEEWSLLEYHDGTAT